MPAGRGGIIDIDWGQHKPARARSKRSEYFSLDHKKTE